MITRASVERRVSLLEDLHAGAAALGALADERDLTTAERRRMGPRPHDLESVALLVVDQDGIFRVREDRVHRSAAGSRRRRALRRGATDDDDVFARVPMRLLRHDQIRGAVDKLDRHLTPARGLFRIHHGASAAEAKSAPVGTDLPPAGRRRALLIVHGTFSNGASLLRHFSSFDEGRDLMADFEKHYDAGVFHFDHPTIAVDPVFNARELATALNGVDAVFDVICHSRGGLVTRWWAQAMARGKARVGKVVFVGCPLAGTSLAAPPNLRAAMDLFANYASLTSTVTSVIPFGQVLSGLFQVIASSMRLASRLPLADALLALLPGLRAQSRVGNNRELAVLRAANELPNENYHVIRSNFEPANPGWHFWQYFRGIGLRMGDFVADRIFVNEAGKPLQNDLVVDSSSMNDWVEDIAIPVSHPHTLDYGTSETVHHTNYFVQPRTMTFLRRTLLA